MPVSLNRRAWLGSVVVAGVAINARPTRATTVARIEKTKVISHLPHRYHGWPTLTRRGSGELLLVYSGGRESHVCPFGRVELMRSHDDGQTWSYPRIVMDGPIDDRDAGVVETQDGSILITSFSSLAYEPILQRAIANGDWTRERRERWRAVHNRVSDRRRQSALGVWMIRSTDDGTTFSGRYDCLVNSPHGPTQLSDGRLLYAGKELWRGKNRIGVCQSRDDGQTWTWLAEIPTRSGDDHHDYHELHVVEAAENRLLVHIRNHNQKNERETLQSESDDGGQTWSTPHEIGVWGLPSHLLSLKDGQLLMTYGYRRQPYGNQARLSPDGGRTWSEPMIISSDGIGGDLGYPSTVQLGDGTLLTVWYERMAGSAQAVLRQARWSIETT